MTALRVRLRGKVRGEDPGSEFDIDDGGGWLCRGDRGGGGKGTGLAVVWAWKVDLAPWGC